MDLDAISQILLSIFSITAIILVARDNKYGFILGLISQPFWFITSFINKQPGVFIANIFFTLSWIYGIERHFFRKKRKLKFHKVFHKNDK